MLRALVWERPLAARGAASARRCRELITRGQIELVAALPDRLVWMDLAAPTGDERSLAAGALRLDPTLESAGLPAGWHRLSMSVVPEVPDLSPDSPADAEAFTTRSEREEALQPLDVLFNRDTLLTIHPAPLALADRLMHVWPHEATGVDESMGRVVCGVLRAVAEGTFPLLDALIARAQALEARFYGGAGRLGDRAQLEDYFRIKEQFHALRRAIGPQREALTALGRDAEGLWGKQATAYVRDVLDSVTLAVETIDLYQGLVDTSLQSYESQVSINLNQVAKALTSLTIILGVPSVVTAIYGMNFEHMPEVHWANGYLYVFALTGVLLLALVLWFRRIEWL